MIKTNQIPNHRAMLALIMQSWCNVQLKNHFHTGLRYYNLAQLRGKHDVAIVIMDTLVQEMIETAGWEVVMSTIIRMQA